MSTEQPTMKELCAKATPGPWIMEPHPADLTLHVYGPQPQCRLVAECYPQTRLGHMENDCNAQLIARCNPAVMLRVVEALESCRDIRGAMSIDVAMTNAEEALALLNGGTP